MVESLSYTYTSNDEISRHLSPDSLGYYNDDGVVVSGSSPTLNTNDAIEEATDTVNVYCLAYYSEASLSNNLWVRRSATWLACYFLTSRRAEPSPYKAQFDRVISLLEKIRDGEMQIPRCSLRSDFAPCASNYVLDDRFPKRRARVQAETSTGTQYSNRPNDITPDPSVFP